MFVNITKIDSSCLTPLGLYFPSPFWIKRMDCVRPAWPYRHSYTLGSWKFFSTDTPPPTKPPNGLPYSFAHTLVIIDDLSFAQLAKTCIERDSICIKLAQEVYDQGVEAYKNNLHGWLVMSKVDKRKQTDRLETSMS